MTLYTRPDRPFTIISFLFELEYARMKDSKLTFEIMQDILIIYLNDVFIKLLPYQMNIPIQVLSSSEKLGLLSDA